MPAPLPTVFVAHGSPMLALDRARGADLARWARAMPAPTAVLAISAHWEHTPPTVGASEPRALVYDFYGFPEALYRVEYPYPGAGDLAARVRARLTAAGLAVADDAERGLDHGAWVPLVHMYPEADVPVLPLSLPSALGARALLDLGRALAPLRHEGVLLLASGVLVHNLGALDRTGRAPPPPWALAFDEWCRDTLARGDYAGLLDYARAPGYRESHPTPEHFLPLLVAAGAASVEALPATFPVTGFELGSLSRRCVQLG